MRAIPAQRTAHHVGVYWILLFRRTRVHKIDLHQGPDREIREAHLGAPVGLPMSVACGFMRSRAVLDCDPLDRRSTTLYLHFVLFPDLMGAVGFEPT